LWLGVVNLVATVVLFALSFLYTWSRDNRADKLEREKKRADLAKKWSETYHDQHRELIRVVRTLGGECDSNIGHVTEHEGFAQNYWINFGNRQAEVNVARDSLVRFWELVYAYDMGNDEFFWTMGDRVWSNRARLFYNILRPLDMVWQLRQPQGQGVEKPHYALTFCQVSVSRFWSRVDNNRERQYDAQEREFSASRERGPSPEDQVFQAVWRSLRNLPAEDV
jgi:hypothetical protein